MKTWVFRLVAVAMSLSTARAIACPVGTTSEQPRRPVQQTQNVSFQASELLERAQALETSASSHEKTATALDREADTLATRARVLRNQAGFVNVADRQSLFSSADELAARAATSRQAASEERTEASDLRSQARTIRERALTLVRNQNGGGWRGRAVPKTTSTTAETSI